MGPGDEVIVPAYTWNATANAVIAARAIPVLAEVDESLTLDPEDVARKIGPATRAILPVHMRGAPADMDALTALAAEHGLALIEDVCQAAGASYRGKRLGTFGDAGAFSLQFNKIITTGEGGAMITDREDLLELAIDVHDCAGSVRRGLGCRSSRGGTSGPRRSRGRSRACSCGGSTGCSSRCAQARRPSPSASRRCRG